MRALSSYASRGFFALMLAGCGDPSASSPTPDRGADHGEGGAGGGGGAPACPLGKEEAAELEVEGGTLAGTMALPAGCGPFPLVLIHAGSGPTDRDGNSAVAGKNDSLRLLAVALQERGVASLRYDKRGVAGSAGVKPTSESELRFGMYVDDAAAWVTSLAADPRVSRVVIAGHSEGSLIGMLAAERGEAWGFVSIAGPGRAAALILREQLAGVAGADAILDELEKGNLVEDVPANLMAVFRPSVQPYLLSWFEHDPAEIFGRLKIPAVVIQGTTDLQVKVKDAQLLAAANPSATLVLVEGMNHVLKFADLTTASQKAAYTDPSLPLVPQVADAIAELALRASR